MDSLLDNNKSYKRITIYKKVRNIFVIIYYFIGFLQFSLNLTKNYKINITMDVSAIS